MDPDATYGALKECMADGDREAVREHAGNLLQWLARGGFMPTGALADGFSPQILAKLLAWVKRVAEM